MIIKAKIRVPFYVQVTRTIAADGDHRARELIVEEAAELVGRGVYHNPRLGVTANIHPTRTWGWKVLEDPDA